MPLISKNNLWFMPLVAWGCIITMCTTFYWNLAVGYSWTLPVIGIVKGPPTPVQQTLFNVIIILAFLIGIGVSIIVILKGNLTQRLVILGPFLLFLSVSVAIIYQTVSRL